MRPGAALVRSVDRRIFSDSPGLVLGVAGVEGLATRARRPLPPGLDETAMRARSLVVESIAMAPEESHSRKPPRRGAARPPGGCHG